MAKRRREALIEAVRRLRPDIEDPAGAITAMRVRVEGVVVTNPNSAVKSGASVRVVDDHEPRGVKKLGWALDHFQVEVAGRVALDVGACTGGFSMALLERGAMQVFAVEVGFGQLLGSLRADERVVNLERTNVADLSAETFAGATIDLVVADVTYVPLRTVVDQITASVPLAPQAVLVGLVKPMFELGRGDAPSTKSDLTAAGQMASDGVAAAGWIVSAVEPSPMPGHGGARELFLHARR